MTEVPSGLGATLEPSPAGRERVGVRVRPEEKLKVLCRTLTHTLSQTMGEGSEAALDSYSQLALRA